MANPIIAVEKSTRVTDYPNGMVYDDAAVVYDTANAYNAFTERDTENIPEVDIPRVIPNYQMESAVGQILNNPAIVMDDAVVTMDSTTVYMEDSTLQSVEDKAKVKV